MTNKRLEPPKEGAGDAAHRAARAVLAVIPGVGGTAVELLNWVLAPPIERRREKWFKSIAAAVEELQDRGVSAESLTENEKFVSAVMSATHIALRTHLQEKLDALRNAIFHVGSNQAPDEARQSIFFNLIDSLSVLHIQVLRFLQEPTTRPNAWHTWRRVLSDNFSALRNDEELANQIWRDLSNFGLLRVTPEAFSGMTDGRVVSGLGEQFLKFIKGSQDTD